MPRRRAGLRAAARWQVKMLAEWRGRIAGAIESREREAWLAGRHLGSLKTFRSLRASRRALIEAVDRGRQEGAQRHVEHPRSAGAGAPGSVLGAVQADVPVGAPELPPGPWSAGASARSRVSSIPSAGEGASRARLGGVIAGAWLRARTDRVVQALIGLLAAGIGLRIWLSLVWAPAFTGYSDSGIYFDDAHTSLWADPIRTQGYSIYLGVMHAIAPFLAPAIYVQELAGLVAVVVVYLAVRRCGGPRWLGLLPAAVLALAADEIFLEHTALSDSLFIFALIVMLYCALRAAFSNSLRWAAACGLVVGLGVWERGAGSVMGAVICLWLLFALGRPSRRTLALAIITGCCALGTVGVYIAWRKLESGMPGLLTTNNAWNFYARAAPWANCNSFTPPPGTTGLCEFTPPSQRLLHGGGEYIYSPESPAQKLFGPPYFVSPYPHAMELMQEWTEAAILGEPLEYLHAVWLDVLRFFNPSARAYSDMSANELMAWLRWGPGERPPAKNEFVEYWQHKLYPSEGPPHHGDVAPLFAFEEVTRLDGVLFGVLLALTLLGPFALGRRVRERAPRLRSGMALFALTALAMLLFPILVKGYDYRFVIPAYAPLVAAATMSAWGLWLRARMRLARRSGPEAGDQAIAARA